MGRKGVWSSQGRVPDPPCSAVPLGPASGSLRLWGASCGDQMGGSGGSDRTQTPGGRVRPRVPAVRAVSPWA